MFVNVFTAWKWQRSRRPRLRTNRTQAAGRRRSRSARASVERLEERAVLSTISGTVFNDLNGNHTWDDDEGGLSGATVYLDVNDNRALDPGELSAVSDANGEYAIQGVTPGDYLVRQLATDDVAPTAPLAGEDIYYAAMRKTTTTPAQLVRVGAKTGMLTVIGPHQISQDLHGLVRTNDGKLFAVAGAGDDSFYSVNPVTGQATLIGRTGMQVGYGLAYDAATDTIYGIGEDAAFLRGLVTFDRTTGQAIPVTPFTGANPSSTSAVAFDSAQNRVLAYNFNDGIIYGFDAATGVGSAVVNAPARMGGNMTFVDGQLVMKRDFGGASNEFLTIDLTTGQTQRLLLASQNFVADGLEFAAGPPFAHRVLVSSGQDVAGIEFGAQRLNSPPLADAGGPYTINEGATVTLDARGSTDADGDELAYHWDLDGDGQFDDASGATVSLSWAELVALGMGDDGAYPIAVQVDDGLATAENATTLTVENVAPVIFSVKTTADTVGSAKPRQRVILTAKFSDAGTLDTHTAVIDWGDGSIISGKVAKGSVTGSHAYLKGGVYEVKVTVTDDDQGAGSQTTTVYVTGVRVVNGVVQIVGTKAADNILVTSNPRYGAEVRGKFVGRPVPFNLAKAKAIEAYLGHGNNKFTVNVRIKTPLLVVGGAGADQITAGGGRSLLIGGAGADVLSGGSNQDLLIAGTTSFDNNAAALRGLLAEWASAKPLPQRLANLSGKAGPGAGQNGNNFLVAGKGGTITHDRVRDVLKGGNATDWFFHEASRDLIRARARDDIFANHLADLLRRR